MDGFCDVDNVASLKSSVELVHVFKNIYSVIMTTIVLQKPVRKRGAPSRRRQVFPVPISSATGKPASNNNWSYYKGRLLGSVVVIEEAEDVEALYHMGFYGKCTISGRQPEHLTGTDSLKFSESSERPMQVLEKRRYKRRQCWKEMQGETSRDSKSARSETENTHQNTTLKPKVNSVVVIEDSSDENDLENYSDKHQPTVEENPYPISEFLHLSLVESFFLVYGLGCLVIEDDRKVKMDVQTFWQHCCSVDPRFVPLYVCYHHFRSKGWVARHELKYGTDFCIYKDGPAYNHASYSVLVQPVLESLRPDTLFPSQKLTWTNFSRLSRTTEQVIKEPLLCYVVRPDDVGIDELKHPSVLSRFQVQEMLLRRWVSSQERENHNTASHSAKLVNKVETV